MPCYDWRQKEVEFWKAIYPYRKQQTSGAFRYAGWTNMSGMDVYRELNGWEGRGQFRKVPSNPKSRSRDQNRNPPSFVPLPDIWPETLLFFTLRLGQTNKWHDSFCHWPPTGGRERSQNESLWIWNRTWEEFCHVPVCRWTMVGIQSICRGHGKELLKIDSLGYHLTPIGQL